MRRDPQSVHRPPRHEYPPMAAAGPPACVASRRPVRLSTFECWPTLFKEREHTLLVIRREKQGGLQLRFQRERLLQRGSRVQSCGPLRCSKGKRRQSGTLGRQAAHLVREILVRHDPVDEADAVGLLSGDVAPGQKQLESPTFTDRPSVTGMCHPLRQNSARSSRSSRRSARSVLLGGCRMLALDCILHPLLARSQLLLLGKRSRAA